MIQHVPISTAALIAILAGAGGFALGQATRSSAGSESARLPTSPDTVDTMPRDLPQDPPNAGDMSGGGLPANHPNVGDMNGAGPGASEATLKWTVPARWKTAPNPNNMRLATYSIPPAAGDSDDPEVSVTQVGGGVDANIDRWAGQFEGSTPSSVKRSSKVVSGMKVTFVEIEGTYSGAMAPGQGAKTNWALCGGIVETDPMPYFFKMTGPAKSVHSACNELQGMLGTVSLK